MLAPITARSQWQVSGSYDAIFPIDTANWKSGFGGTLGIGGQLSESVSLSGNFSYYGLTAKSDTLDGTVMNISFLAKAALSAQSAFRPFVGLRLGVSIWSFDFKNSRDRTDSAPLTGFLGGIGYAFSDKLTVELNAENALILFRGMTFGYPSVSLRGVLTL